MAGFPKNPLAGPDPFRDAAGQNLFCDAEGVGGGTSATANGPATSTGEASEFGATSGNGPLREFELGDFEPLSADRSGRITLTAWSAMLVVAVAWLATVLTWLLLPSANWLRLSFLVWHLLVLVLGGFAWFWGRDELEGIRLGAIDGRALGSIKSARRVALLATLLALAGCGTLITRAMIEVGS